MAEAQKNLSEMSKQVEQAAAKVAGAELKLHSIKGPLFAATQQEMMPLLGKIRVRIYGLAGIKLPEGQREPVAGSAAAAPLRILQRWGDEPDLPLGGLAAEMQTYQNLLFSRFQFIEENRQQEQALLNVLQEEKGDLEGMIQTLNDALLSARQTREGAIEVQKRVGRRQIQPDQVPPNLDQLMDRTILERSVPRSAFCRIWINYSKVLPWPTRTGRKPRKRILPKRPFEPDPIRIPAGLLRFRTGQGLDRDPAGVFCRGDPAGKKDQESFPAGKSV
jgi:hypothetical protein